jgi:hypothetical protein
VFRGHGLALSHLVKVHVWLKDINDLPSMEHPWQHSDLPRTDHWTWASQSSTPGTRCTSEWK